MQIQIENYQLSVLAKRLTPRKPQLNPIEAMSKSWANPIETKIKEAQLIDKLRRYLNIKMEIACWYWLPLHT